jgi:hypothetical protein
MYKSVTALAKRSHIYKNQFKDLHSGVSGGGVEFLLWKKQNPFATGVMHQ